MDELIHKYSITYKNSRIGNQAKLYWYTRAYLLYEKSKRPIFGPKICNESSFAGHIMQTIINICLRKNKSKQSCVWID